MDANKTAGEEARRQLHKNATCNLKQVLAATPHKTPTVRPLTPITKTIQVRRARHAGHGWRCRNELISDVLLWTPTHGRAKAGRPARTVCSCWSSCFCSYVRIRDVVLKTYLGRWTIGKSGERGSGISVLPARYDDDDDDDISYPFCVVSSFEPPFDHNKFAPHGRSMACNAITGRLSFLK